MKKSILEKIDFVSGGGRFAIAIARVVALNNPELAVQILLRYPEYVEAAQKGNFDHFFPGIRQNVEIPRNLFFSTNKDFANIDPETLKYFFMAYPAQDTPEALQNLKAMNLPALLNCLFLSGTKGIVIKTRQLMSQLLKEKLPGSSEKIAVMVGPNIAADIFEGAPVVSTIAGPPATTGEFAKLFAGSPILRAHESEEILGLDFAGVIKNIHSIAFGIALTFGLHASTVGTIMQGALRELDSFVAGFGCDRSAVSIGMSGDYQLALSGATRNAKAGIEFAQTGKLPENYLVEGVFSLPIILELAREKNIRMPIVEMLNEVLNNGVKPQKALEELIRFGRDTYRLNS
ncbi:MAG: hypothetical protein V1936_04295 [Patescibacteria group bacterium]